MPTIHVLTILLPLSLIICGCETVAEAPRRPMTSSEAAAPQPRGGSVPLLIDGQPVAWEVLQPVLAESAGRIAVEEVALDYLLREELARRGIDTASLSIDLELAQLRESLAGPRYDPDDTEEMIESLARSRGLGPTRFEGLLRRNAMLRALVAPTVIVSEDEIDLALEVSRGPRFLARVLVVPVEREAARLREQVLRSPDGIRIAFIEAALESSIDPTAPAGGLLEPVSPIDPGVAEVVRATLRNMRAGDVSQVVAIDRGYALLFLEREIPRQTVGPAERDRSRATLQRRKERLEMSRLANQLIERARIGVLDAGLAWSWEGRSPS